MQILDPQIQKPARPLSAADREDSMAPGQKCQKPAEANTVLTNVGAYNGNESATLMDDQNALHIAKVNGLLNMDQFGVGGGGRQTAIATSSLDTLVSKQWTDHTK